MAVGRYSLQRINRDRCALLQSLRALYPLFEIVKFTLECCFLAMAALLSVAIAEPIQRIAR